MEMDIEEFRRRFPNLAKELLGPRTIRIDSVRSSISEAEKVVKGEFPTVIDFLRRCDTDEQALEIINYFERRGEISEEYAAELRVQLVRYGVRSFGSKLEREWFLRGDEGT